MLTTSFFRLARAIRTTLLVQDEGGSWLESVYVVDNGLGEALSLFDAHGNAVECLAADLAAFEAMVQTRREASGEARCSECGYRNELSGFKVPRVPGFTRVVCLHCSVAVELNHAFATGALKLVPAPGCENMPTELDPWDYAEPEVCEECGEEYPETAELINPHHGEFCSLNPANIRAA